LALCTLASPTALAIARAQAEEDRGRTAAAVTAVASAAAKAQKPPASASDGIVQSNGRILTPDGKLMYVNVFSLDESVDQNSLHDSANRYVMARLARIKGMGMPTLLGNRKYAVRIWLDPDRMRAFNLSSDDIMKALSQQSMTGSPPRFSNAATKSSQSKEYVLIVSGRYNKPDPYANVIVRANADGEIVQLKDVGEVELGPRFLDIDSVSNGHPGVSILLKKAPGSTAVEVIEATKMELANIKKESFSPGMDFEIMPLEKQGMIYAVIETPPGATREYTSDKCHKLAAIAKHFEEITSVSSLAGYDVRTEGRAPNTGTCLLHLKNRSDRKLTSPQIIEKLEEKCRTISNVKLEFFEPAAVSVFVAAGGFSVRLVDTLGKVPETSMDDLLKRKDLQGLFTFFANNYPQYELVIDTDMATQKRASIASAFEYLVQLQPEPNFRRLVEDFANLFLKSDRGEMVPFSSFMQLKKK
jgi:multidrug efflux pump subunit AcrB